MFEYEYGVFNTLPYVYELEVIVVGSTHLESISVIARKRQSKMGI